MRRKHLDGLLLHLGNALVTLALLFGGLEAFLSAHAYGYSRGELLAVCALASVLAVGLYAWRHGGWAVLGLLAVLPWPGIPCGRSCWSRRRTCSAPPGRGAPGCPF